MITPFLAFAMLGAIDSAIASNGSGGSPGVVMAASSGGAIVRGGERPMGAFPESGPYPSSS